jgi:Cro/C1-type HTH DNA-binding domain
MVNPDTVRTQQQLVEALKQLTADSGKTASRLSRDTGLSENTVRAVVSGANFPQLNTVEVLVSKGSG